PLIVMSPKSLLRNARVYSSPRDLAEGHWRPVIDDAQAVAGRAAVRRLILCSGKVYVDMSADPRRADCRDVAIARVEQLYPWPEAELNEVIEGYPDAREIVWLQEEPTNAGAWEFVQPRLLRQLGGRLPLRLIARPRRASPAEGTMAMHIFSQTGLLDRAYEVNEEMTTP
ncbi:MAG TPA: 2-oxoglutarate dehydrogenase E1 component, partial [Promineifilum sp.]|nr:2-oxoglutarate dehydrogenase E1 component [Promineifilum sp.]